MCPAGTFRSSEITKCAPCPLNSKATKNGSSYCACSDGYYRHPRDSLNMPCYRPPSKPTNLTLLFMDQTSAILSWNAPQRPTNELYDSKYRSDIVFKVRCSACGSNVVFMPATETFNDTKLAINNLEPVTTYTIQIHALNSVSYAIYSDMDGNGEANASADGVHGHAAGGFGAVGQGAAEPPTEYAEITFTTESAILSMVFNIRIVSITSREVELAWDNPMHSEVPIESYEVRWFPKMELDAVNKTTLSTHEQRAHIDNLLENTEYGFQVRCKTANGFGQYSNIVYGQTHQGVSPGKVGRPPPFDATHESQTQKCTHFSSRLSLSPPNTVYDDSMQMRILAGGTVAFVCILVLGKVNAPIVEFRAVHFYCTHFANSSAFICSYCSECLVYALEESRRIGQKDKQSPAASDGLCQQ